MFSHDQFWIFAYYFKFPEIKLWLQSKFLSFHLLMYGQSYFLHDCDLKLFNKVFKMIFPSILKTSKFFLFVSNSRVNESVKMDSSKLTKQPWCFSADSLVTENDGPYSSDSVPACFQMQCSQIFIGMVSMQYQARLVGTNLCSERKVFITTCGV